MSESRQKSYVMMGCKHCGKTTQGKKLAEEMGVPFIDTDAVIEKMVGMPFREYYQKHGAGKFMQAEEAACKRIIDEYGDQSIVVSTGGGICDNAPALNILRQLDCFVFMELNIDYSISRIASRIKKDVMGNWENCPAYVLEKKPKNMSEINEILTAKFTERFDQYRHIADIIVNIKDAPIEENYKTIRDALL